MFSILILIYIVNYIIILLVLINFISTNFKIFFMRCRRANRAKFAQNSENLAGETLRLPLQAYLNRGGVGQQATSHSTPLPFVP